MIGLTYTELQTLKPCSERLKVVTKLLGGSRKWNGHKISAKRAVKAGITFDDLVWCASALAKINPEIARRLRLWLADCAAHVLPIYESYAPTDKRVRECISAQRAFARGQITDAARSAARFAARSAVRSAASDAANDAVRSAASYADDAAWSAASDVARSAVRSAAGDAASDAEQKWQFERLVAWLSDPEPSDYNA
jgi:hypothetical protein